MKAPPFNQDTELKDELQEAPTPLLLHSRTKDGSQVNFSDIPVALLPGRPLLQLGTQEVVSHISNELLTPDLDRLAPLLWLVGTQRSSHISSLHQQIVKGRQIIIAENIELHCTWILDRVFLKPVPAFLMSWAFWQQYLISDDSPIPTNLRDSLRRGALGYLRTYFHLIRYPSDFRLAIEHHLIPEDTNFERCSQFFARFGQRLDEEVSPRYNNYGELRLGLPGGYVRLLKMQHPQNPSIDFEEIIEISLVSVPLAEYPPDVTLSYTWAEPEPFVDQL